MLTKYFDNVKGSLFECSRGPFYEQKDKGYRPPVVRLGGLPIPFMVYEGLPRYRTIQINSTFF